MHINIMNKFKNYNQIFTLKLKKVKETTLLMENKNFIN